MKKLFACLLVLAFVLSAIPVSAVAPMENPVWDGSVADGFAGGTGTAADPYQIADGSQLAYLAQQVNGGTTYQETYFVLTADIRLNDTSDLENWETTAPANLWTPIGSYSDWNLFAGNLNGNGHTVSGIYCVTADYYAGLFCATTYEGTVIQNLTIADSYFSAPGCVGVLAGELSNTSVRNVTVFNCTVTGEYDLGGLAGCAYSSVVQNVTVTGGSISGFDYLAGILAEAYGCTVTGCHAAVAISGVYYDLAGICGYACSTQIVGCTSITQIYVACEEENTYVYEIGGIAGYADSESQVVNCLNAGDISVQGNICMQIGGIVGYSQGIIRDCCNTGSVSVTGNSQAYQIGGILGYLGEGSLENAYNSGIMTVSSGDTTVNIGGAAGSQYDGTTVQNTYYLADCVSGDSMIGTALSGEQVSQESSFPNFDFGWRWGITSLGPVIATHTVVNGVCTHCGQNCSHTYISGICADCGEACTHTTMNGGFCTDCGYRCNHSYVSGVCAACGMVCSHIYQNGVCTLCNMTCDHQWNGDLSMCTVCNTLCTHEGIENETCIQCQAVLSGNVWDGSVADGFDGGTGTKEDPYRIATGAQLAWFGQYISLYNDGPAFADQYVALTADINLRNLPFDPIGYSSSEGYSNWFTGWFDGQGHTISGLNINNSDSNSVGLFSSVALRSEGEAGVVNLNVIGSVTSDSQYVGGIVGRMEQATVSGCSFTGQVTGGQYTGGILGQGEQGQIRNCMNYASVTGTQWTGGICGGTEYNAPKLNGCINYGYVRGQEYVAGITARHNKMTAYDEEGNDIGSVNPVVNCGNYGILTVLGADNDYATYVVAGIAYGFSGQVDNCYNVGDMVSMVDGVTMLGITDSSLDCRNSFYACNGNGQFGYGYVTENSYAAITAEDMKTQTFLDTLNAQATANGWTQWKLGSTYPVFVTETVEAPAPAITGTSLVLESILRLQIYVTGQEPVLRVTVGETEQTLTDYTDRDGKLTFEVALPVHRLQESVTMELLVAGQVADTKTWTYEGYSDSLRQDFSENTSMMTLLESLDDYGSYARYFADPVGEAPNADTVEVVTKAELQPFAHKFVISSALGLQAVASLYLDDACDLQIKFNAAAWNGYTLYINGEAVTVTAAGQQMIYVIRELMPQQWDDVYEIRVANTAGETVYQFTYCVLSYARAQLGMAQESKTGLNGLLKAMYLYNRAANDYIGE